MDEEYLKCPKCGTVTTNDPIGYSPSVPWCPKCKVIVNDTEEEDTLEQFNESWMGKVIAKIPHREKFLIAFLLVFMFMAYMAAKRYDVLVGEYNSCAMQLNMLKNGTYSIASLV